MSIKSFLRSLFPSKNKAESIISNEGQTRSGMSSLSSKIELPKKEFSKKSFFKSSEEKHREKLLKEYEEGKILKFEDPKPIQNNSQNNQNFKKKKNKNKFKNFENRGF